MDSTYGNTSDTSNTVADSDIYELAPEFEAEGWWEWDLLDAFDIIGDALDYLDEQGYM